MSTRLELNGQLPLPFRWGLRVGKPPRTWKTIDGQVAKRCPACGCHRDAPCRIEYAGLEGRCVPAGVFGHRVCSACWARR